MLLQVHDELVFDVLKSEKIVLKKWLKWKWKMLLISDCPYWWMLVLEKIGSRLIDLWMDKVKKTECFS